MESSVRPLQFVWFWIQTPDHGQELKYSIRSVLKHFDGDARVTVVGEKPRWYDGHHIPMRQIRGHREASGRLPFRDTQHKIMQCAEHPEIDDRFCWIMDDTFMMKTVTESDLLVPRYDPWYRVNNRTIWHQLIRMTFAALEQHGRPKLQHGTHLPHIFEKTKLKEMFGIYDFPKKLLLFEILYKNHFFDAAECVPYGGTWQGVKQHQFLQRILNLRTRAQLDQIDANMVNLQARMWCPTVQSWIEGRFNE